MEKQIIDYTACRATDLTTLRQLVIESIEAGFQPFGSLGVTGCTLDLHGNPYNSATGGGHTEQGFMFTQGLVKYAQ